MEASTYRKKLTDVTSEGFVVELATGAVIGFKCLGCSTTSIYKDVTPEELVDSISMDMDIHKDCGRL